MSRSEPIVVTYTGTRAPIDPPEGVEIRHRPLLEVSPLDLDVDGLAELTAEPTGLVVFSKNAIRSLQHNGARGALSPLSRHTWWAVGEKTAEYLHDEFGVRARYPDDQCFEGLQLAFEGADLPKRVLAFTLEGTSRDLSPALEDRGIDYRQLPVYRTDPADDWSLEDLVDSADWLVATSSKGVDALFRSGSSSDEVVEHLETVRVATIGPKTARAARDRGLDVSFVPPEPDRDALLRKIAARARSGPGSPADPSDSNPEPSEETD